MRVSTPFTVTLLVGGGSGSAGGSIGTASSSCAHTSGPEHGADAAILLVGHPKPHETDCINLTANAESAPAFGADKHVVLDVDSRVNSPTRRKVFVTVTVTERHALSQDAPSTAATTTTTSTATLDATLYGISNMCKPETLVVDQDSDGSIYVYMDCYGGWLYGWNWSELDLDNSIGNQNGQLVRMKRGNFGHADAGRCSHCGPTPDADFTMHCSCPRDDGNMSDAFIDLTTVLVVLSGRLCDAFHQCGNWVPGPPSR